MKEFILDICSLFLLLLAGILLYGFESRETLGFERSSLLCNRVRKSQPFFYYIHDSNTNLEFKAETRAILINSRINNKFTIRETDDQKLADISIELRSRSSLTKHHSNLEYYPGTTKPIRFSFTWQYTKPYIAIDDINWTNGVKESGLSLFEYRKYVIQHEFMHALGYDHQPCNTNTAVNGVCPILYQSTRGPPVGFKSGYEVLDIDYTKKIRV